jgi:hypothetical protein
MSNFIRHGVCVALLAASSIGAAAEADLGERVAACAREREDAARLACFDRLATKPAAAAKSAPVAQAPPEVREATSAAPTEAPKAAATAGAAGAAATAATSAPAARPATDEFGVTGTPVARERDAEAQTQPGAQEKIDRITATVTAISKQPHGELVVTLDNGQVWAQKQAQYVPLNVGDQIAIAAGALHSYRMIVAGRATAVTRIK